MSSIDSGALAAIAAASTNANREKYRKRHEENLKRYAEYEKLNLPKSKIRIALETLISMIRLIFCLAMLAGLVYFLIWFIGSLQ